MPQSLARIYLHILFSTKYRKPWITKSIRTDLHAYLAGTIRALKCEAYRVGGIEDHVHIACRLHRTISVSKLMEEIKTSSSSWIKKQDIEHQSFEWQRGYTVFSVGSSGLKSLLRYIDNQVEHHRSRNYKEEVLGFLDQYGIVCDEQYLWD